MKSVNLCLHCGAAAVDRTALNAVVVPEATDTWYPIPHEALVQTVEDRLSAYHLSIVNQSHALTREGTRYFGLFQIARAGITSTDYSWIVGVRNSLDKSFPAGLCAGTQVFVCDNLAFNGEIAVTRRHTRHIMRDLPGIIGTAVGRLFDSWQSQDMRVTAYKNIPVQDHNAHDLVIQALDTGAICTETIKPSLNEWRDPKHEEFRPRTLWSFFNAVTESLKGRSLHLLPKRTTALYGICDNYAQQHAALVAG